MYVCMYVCMYVPVGKANLLRGWINTASPSLVPRWEGRPGTHCSRMRRIFPTFQLFKHRKYTLVPRNYRKIRRMREQCVPGLPSLPPRKAWERGYASPYISKCLPIQCTMYGAVRQTSICLFKFTICFSILLKVLWKLCTGTHTVGSPASTHNSSIRDS